MSLYKQLPSSIYHETHEVFVDLKKEHDALYVDSVASKEEPSQSNYIARLSELIHNTILDDQFGKKIPNVENPDRRLTLLLTQIRKNPSENKASVPVSKIYFFLHGASAGSYTFLAPGISGHADTTQQISETDNPGIAQWLVQNEACEVWLLDWRGSFVVTDTLIEEDDHSPKLEQFKTLFNYDMVAAQDLPIALGAMIHLVRSSQNNDVEYAKNVDIVLAGHCMGAASLSIAVSLGVVNKIKTVLAGQVDNDNERNVHFSIDNLILSTVGLFYEVSLDGHLKTQEHVLERVHNDVITVDPRVVFLNSSTHGKKFHHSIGQLYKNWLGLWSTHRQSNGNASHTYPGEMEYCNQLSFLYGLPYTESRLSSKMHKNLDQQFGGIPIDLFLHAVWNTRTGWAVPFSIGLQWQDICQQENAYINKTSRQYFHEFNSIILITGNENRLWHRNSVDMMYEWLQRDFISKKQGQTVTKSIKKYVISDYGHQDLLWGEDAHNDIFKYFLV